MMRSAWMAVSVVLMFACAAAAQQKRPAGNPATKPAAKPAAKNATAPAATSETTAKPTGTVEKAETPADKPADDATNNDPAVIEFENVFVEWKDLLAKLQELRAKYIATPRKGGLRPPIKKEYDELVKQGDKLEPKIIQAAEAAFAVVGNDRPEIGKFLASQLKNAVDHDNDELAVPIARSLIHNQYNNPRMYDYGGLAAYATGDFDDAVAWLNEGDKHNVLGTLSKQSLVHIDQAREKWDEEAAIREAEKKADDLPRVLLKTSQGDITVELFENEAPNTVANFVSLVEKKFYDGVKFHRVLPHFMAQGGDPEGTGTGGPGYNIPDETDNPKYRRHFRGSLSMANTGQPNTGGSQFFLCFLPTDYLDGKHTVFGRVIDGIEVLARIKRTEAEPDKQDQNFVPPAPNELDRIVEATVVRKRKHEYVPKKAAE